MNNRQRPPNRRPCETFVLECNGLRYLATISRFADGRRCCRPCEAVIMISRDSESAKDAAVVCSIALQHGITIDVIRHALLRDSHGRASSPLGAVLDIIAGAP